jgi:hypothetical protein
MKKKWITLGSAVGISCAIMVTTGMTAMADTSGYDVYKSALKNTKTVTSVSVAAQAELKDNGNVLVSANGTAKASLDNKTGSGSVDVTSNGVQQTISFYNQENGTVIKSSASDVYYQNQDEKGKRGEGKKHNEQDMAPQVESVIDALVGNLKDYVSTNTQSDGSKVVSVELSNAQIPAALNAFAPIAIKQATNEHEHQGKKNEGDQAKLPFAKDFLKGQVPQLTQDIKIEKVAVKATINASNYIEQQQADLTVSGKDANGAAHVVTLHVNADLSGYNSTTPDQVDLTGKNVQQIKHDHKGNYEK